MRLIRKIPRAGWIAAGAVIVLLLASGTYFLIQPKQPEAPAQPVPFDHEVMVSSGVQCLYCHADARRSAVAGMPSVEKCMGCHRVIKTSSDEIEQVAAYWEAGEPIPWVRVNQLPRYVYFSHQAHVVAGQLNCEECHGDVAHMAEAQPIPNLTMGWCISCHEKQPNRQQLMDCAICHK